MSKVCRIVVHCTATRAGSRVTREGLRHQFFEVNHWKHWGYHVVVYEDGTWEVLQPLPKVWSYGGFIDNSTMANGARGYNLDSLHIAYAGGLDKQTGKPADTRTDAQKETLRVLITSWMLKYRVTEVVGHCQLPNVCKACPCFDARKEYSDVRLG